ncbi:hypothetical protein AJ78_07525 [Emergomyces pasteurianus Ep9510]|uniref:F-box domain-containing protein n=1 Tax=Emergomyces pasteurianus Ep9510 TaxID=1447872 RepID=A0A1J9Q9B5_9EURO|nr:hypothetical protein AJ78_07525 [Emergomyces pasteurianus Ep9510]
MVVYIDHEHQDLNFAAPGLRYRRHPHRLLSAHPNTIFPKDAVHPMFMNSHPPLPSTSGGGHATPRMGSGGGDMDHDKDSDKECPALKNNNNVSGGGQRANPNVNGFSAALSCYPVVVQIARSVDLNTLDSLSMTCHQFRANLLPFRSQLIRETLRCRNELLDENTSKKKGDDGEIRAPGFVADDVPGVFQIFPQPATSAASIARDGYSRIARFATGKVGRCARDMVTQCQRCLGNICRNCTLKPVGASMLKNRFRRLCSTCLAAPLSDHFLPSVRPTHDNHEHQQHYRPSLPPQTRTQTFTDSVFDLKACHCEESFWLCKPCGQILRSDDTTYKRVWSWRTRYSAYLGGGLGTGIGEGWQGVKCGRGERCFAAEEIEMEVDCEVDDWTFEDSDHQIHPHGSNSGDGNHCNSLQHSDGHVDEEPGYLRQEIEGVGGVVKQKVKKRVRVGACVEEHEDEREAASYLKREYLGDVRSWCGWCERVVPCRKEREALE